MAQSSKVLAQWIESGRAREEVVPSPEQGVDLFDRLHRAFAGAPTLVNFGPVGSGQVLSIGAGRPQSVLAFQASLDPPYYASRGDQAHEGDIWFIVGGENTQFPARSAIPVDKARRALADYLRDGERPEAIDWDEV